MTDKKLLYIISSTTLAVLLLALLLPGEHVGRYVAAILLIPLAIFTWFFIKKRSIPSPNYKEILLILVVFGVIYVVIYFLTGLSFDFYKNPTRLSFERFFSYILPTVAIILSSEVIRWIIRAQEDKIADRLCYAACVVASTMVYGNIHYIVTFNRFMDFVGLYLFPAVISNLLFHYLSKRYGMYPNIAYRIITSLYVYLIPILPNMADSLFALYNLAFPIIVYFFIDSLYEKKIKYALAKKSKFAVPITVIAAAILIGFVMLISNQFYYGTLVVATDSMTGELNKGDAALFERYEDQTIIEGQVIVFEKNDVLVIHRVADIQIIKGIRRYFTKGDANKDLDAGFIFDHDIVGLVNFKVPYVGYPTLWLRSLFDR